MRQTIKVSGIDGIALTKLDVLDELDEIKMCVAYELDGKRLDYLPAAVEDQMKIKPIYKTFRDGKFLPVVSKTWTRCRKCKKIYFCSRRFLLVQVSPSLPVQERDDTILIENPFEV